MLTNIYLSTYLWFLFHHVTRTPPPILLQCIYCILVCVGLVPLFIHSTLLLLHGNTPTTHTYLFPRKIDSMGNHLRSVRQDLLFDGNLESLLVGGWNWLKAQGDHQLSLRKGIFESPISGRTRPPALSQWRWTMHWLQIVRIRLSRPSHYHWSGRTRGRCSAYDRLRYWHDEMYLLWLLSRGLSRRCHCAGTQLRICDRNGKYRQSI